MGYEFDIIWDEVNFFEPFLFKEFNKELEEIPGAEHWYGEFYLDTEAPVLYPSLYHFAQLQLKHDCCPKLYDLDKIFKLISKYAEGEIEIKGEYGERAAIKFNGDGTYTPTFYKIVYEEVSLDTYPDLKKKF